MIKATYDDIKANKLGQPGLNKMKIVDKVLMVLKNEIYTNAFLEQAGLSVINDFISRLPDGSWPLTSVRTKILKFISGLPVSFENIKNCQLRETIELIRSNKKEFTENIKICNEISQKWERIVSQKSAVYKDLGNEEAENFRTEALLYKRKNLFDEDGTVSFLF